MDFDTPQSRNEAILQNILGADNVLVATQSNIEEILKCILYNEVYTGEDKSRIGILLQCILNGEDTDMIPRSRNEAILIAKIKGEEYTKAPQSRIEELLIEWSNVVQSYTGGGLVYNQVVQNGNFEGTTNWAVTNTAIMTADNNVLTLVTGNTSAQGIREETTPTSSADIGHVMIGFVTARTNYEGGTRITLSKARETISQNVIISSQSIDTEWKTVSGVGTIASALSDAYNTRIAMPNAYVIPVGNSLYLKDVNVIDLTKFFGSNTIPNYILSLETQETGSGVAWFREHFPDAYYPYNAGTLTVVDKNNYKLFGYKNWVLGDNVLRGVPTLVDGELVWDGDEYQSGVITRKYGIVDLGSLTWTYAEQSGNVYSGRFYSPLADIAHGENGYAYTKNLLLAKDYKTMFETPIGYNSMISGITNTDNIIWQYTTNGGIPNICIKDSSFGSDEDAFKTAMNGVYLIYELATSVTVQLTP